MRALSLISTFVFATLPIAGCGSKPKTRAPVPAAASAHTKAPQVATTEPATGDLLEALLHLRRVHFGFDTASLLPESRSALEEAAESLKAHPKVHVYIDGHTDERGTSEYNLALGERRSQAVAAYLMRLGISEGRLHILTLGREQPWVEGSNEVAHAKNRRAEFRLMRGNVRLILDDGVLYNDKGKRMASARLQ